MIERTIERTKEAAPAPQAPNVQINVPQPANSSDDSAPANSPSEATGAEPAADQPSEQAPKQGTN